MERLLLEQLEGWRQQAGRKPILVDGARQVGKSYLIEHLFGAGRFHQIHKLDFRAEPTLAEVFADGLKPEVVLANIELRLNCDISIEQDLIFFDEVGECQAAVDSLKYFAEELPQAFVCASGSNIGLLDSFPVGKVHQLELFPLCFEEFLMAAAQPKLLHFFQQRNQSQAVHALLWPLLLDYFYVGGMPEAVAAWFESQAGLNERTQQVAQIHRELLAGYQRDFGKYAGAIQAQHIATVFANVPRQLAASHDDSVRRYRFNGVIEKKQRYRELRGPVDWLEKAGLVSRCYLISGRPEIPLAAKTQDKMFRLFLFDLGLLGYMLGMSYSAQQEQKTSYKGFIAENFVQNELRASGVHPTYGWHQARAEIEFLHPCGDGTIMPVEVKSGRRTRARSLRAYIDRYAPERALKLAGVAGGPGDGVVTTWPLYYARHLSQL